MKPIHLPILLLSLLFTGVVEAGDFDFKLPKPMPSSSIDAKITYQTQGTGNVCPEYTDKGMRMVTCGKVQPIAQVTKKVIFEYDDVIKIMADKEHREKLLNQCAAERAILLKLKDEQGKTISIQADQVKGLIETAETQERLGATEAQINEALQKQLAKVTQDLENEKSKKYWWAGGSAVSSAAMVTAIFLWVVN